MRFSSTLLAGLSACLSVIQPSSVECAVDANNPLIVYTYKSMMAYGTAGEYDFSEEFRVANSLPVSSVKLYRLPQSGDVLKAATNWTQFGVQGPPDILLGTDNVQADIFAAHVIPFNLTLENELHDELKNLNHEAAFKPFDHNLITLVYDSVKLPQIIPYVNNFNLETLLTSGLISEVVAEDPNLSTSGLGFLLWTILEYGDPTIGLKGVQPESVGDWRQFWTRAFQRNVTIAKSWDEAWNQFADANVKNVNMMVSYGTDPAYNVCFNYSDTIRTVTSKVNGVTYGWTQIEGMSITAVSKNVDTAKQFVDYLFSQSFQFTIATNNWMLPTNSKIAFPACYLKSPSIYPHDVKTYNSALVDQKIEIGKHMTRWLSVWTDLYNNRNTNNNNNNNNNDNAHKVGCASINNVDNVMMFAIFLLFVMMQIKN